MKTFSGSSHDAAFRGLESPEAAFSTQAALTSRSRHLGERVMEKLLFIAGLSSTVIIALIFIFLFKEAIFFFQTASPAELVGKMAYDAWDEKNVYTMTWQPVSDVDPKYSLLPLISGSFLVSLPAILISAIFGVGCAIYLSEIASPRAREILKPLIELLAGIPSVVLGFLMLALTASFIQDLFETKFRLNAFVGAVGIAIATMPLIITLSEDALRAVPKELKDASYALGASRWQTILGTTVPAAVSGISASVILGFGRALGETMIVLMATGNAALITGDIFSSVRTMTATLAAELGEVAQGDEHYYALFVVGAVLFTFTFLLNIVAEYFLNKTRKKLRMGA